MSLAALGMMAQQMNDGLVYLPRHNMGLASMEWSDVIGRTVRAEIIESDVANPRFEGETQHVLNVTTDLFDDGPRASELVKRLSRGESIGQSIGGWFTELQIITDDEDGAVIDMIVMAVDLDHLAVTRAPANPDSDGLDVLRSKLVDTFRAAYKITGVEDVYNVIKNGADRADPAAAERKVHDIETHERIEPACLSVDVADGRVALSWDVGADPEVVRAAIAKGIAGEFGEELQRTFEAFAPPPPEEAPATEDRRAALAAELARRDAEGV